MAPHTGTPPLTLLRETSRLADPQLPSDGESCTSSSLPTHLTLPPSPKPPIYGRPTMQPDDFHKMVEPRITSFSCADFLLGYMRLCLAAANVHKGVTNKVCMRYKLLTIFVWLSVLAEIRYLLAIFSLLCVIAGDHCLQQGSVSELPRVCCSETCEQG